MRSLLHEYLSELSQFGSFDLAYPRFDLYWTEAGRRAFFIAHGDDVAGLVFLCDGLSSTGLPTDCAITEFYVRPDAGHAAWGGQRHCKRSR